MNNVICGGVEGQGAGGEKLNRDRDDAELAALEGLSLDELGAIAAREIGEARQLQAEAVGLSRRSTVTLYRAGRALWCGRKMLKGKGKRAWTRWQKSNGIPVTSAWQAIRLYEEAEGEEAVAGLTRIQALKKYGITKPRKSQTQQAPVEVSNAPEAGVTAPAQDTPPEWTDLRLIPKRDDEVGGTTTAEDVEETDQAEGAEEPQAAPSTPSAADILLLIARRLETLEQDYRGGDLDEDVHALINRAIASLLRLRGEAASVTEAA